MERDMGKIRKAVRSGVEGVAYGIETAEFGVDTDPQIRVLRRGYGAGAVTDTLPQKLPKSEQVLNLISSIEGTGPLAGQSTVAGTWIRYGSAYGYGTIRLRLE
jgi:hypothetical protein